MVALGGLVWNAPGSCAWAARVLVNSKDARSHGVKTCGLPSHFAHFAHSAHGGMAGAAKAGAEEGEGEVIPGWWTNTRRPRGKFFRWFRGGSGDGGGDNTGRKTNTPKANKGAKVAAGSAGADARSGRGSARLELHDEDDKDIWCTLALPPAAPSLSGPRITIALPSFSGRTSVCPHLLKYSLDLRANVRLSDAIRVEVEAEEGEHEIRGDGKPGSCKESWRDVWQARGVRRFPPQMAVASVIPSSPPLALAPTPTPESVAKRRVKDEALAAIIGGKPLLCIAFDRMEMDVGSPMRVG